MIGAFTWLRTRTIPGPCKLVQWYEGICLSVGYRDVCRFVLTACFHALGSTESPNKMRLQLLVAVLLFTGMKMFTGCSTMCFFSVCVCVCALSGLLTVALQQNVCPFLTPLMWPGPAGIMSPAPRCKVNILQFAQGSASAASQPPPHTHTLRHTYQTRRWRSRPQLRAGPLPLWEDTEDPLCDTFPLHISCLLTLTCTVEINLTKSDSKSLITHFC